MLPIRIVIMSKVLIKKAISIVVVSVVRITAAKGAYPSEDPL